MTERPLKNVVASIHQRLLNASKQIGRAFNDLVLYYAIERFLYRLSQSPHADRVVLKGGLMLNVWNAPMTRVTRDIDLLGRFSNDLDRVADVVRVVCSVAVEDDGLVFDPTTVTTRRIAEDADYEGVRATFRGNFGKVPLAMRIDFGFSDVITPAPVPITYPSVLDHSPPKLMAYNRETAVAEKFEAMVKHGELNSRMRDFFDVWVLAQTFAFDGRLLADAVRATFDRRQTAIEIEPVCFSDRFVTTPAKVAQWNGFIKNSRVAPAPTGFAAVVGHVEQFLKPIAQALAEDEAFERQWPAGGTWQ
ncbi:MAG: nucleotidyl transferase AbiEii/AbiGii toxin family protein [Phycisphaeraceae bacterium]|nr:nucleotidyl transferase AbiEii/AbiGii toxin family protein [Phycisphaeraceae bacterium]